MLYVTLAPVNGLTFYFDPATRRLWSDRDDYHSLSTIAKPGCAGALHAACLLALEKDHESLRELAVEEALKAYTVPEWDAFTG